MNSRRQKNASPRAKGWLLAMVLILANMALLLGTPPDLLARFEYEPGECVHQGGPHFPGECECEASIVYEWCDVNGVDPEGECSEWAPHICRDSAN
jgi:hypothetical protein